MDGAFSSIDGVDRSIESIGGGRLDGSVAVGVHSFIRPRVVARALGDGDGDGARGRRARGDRSRRARVVPPSGERGRARGRGGSASLGESRARPRRQEAPAVRATKAEDVMFHNKLPRRRWWRRRPLRRRWRAHGGALQPQPHGLVDACREDGRRDLAPVQFKKGVRQALGVRLSRVS